MTRKLPIIIYYVKIFIKSVCFIFKYIKINLELHAPMYYKRSCLGPTFLFFYNEYVLLLEQEKKIMFFFLFVCFVFVFLSFCYFLGHSCGIWRFPG